MHDTPNYTLHLIVDLRIGGVCWGNSEGYLAALVMKQQPDLRAGDGDNGKRGRPPKIPGRTKIKIAQPFSEELLAEISPNAMISYSQREFSKMRMRY